MNYQYLLKLTKVWPFLSFWQTSSNTFITQYVIITKNISTITNGIIIALSGEKLKIKKSKILNYKIWER